MSSRRNYRRAKREQQKQGAELEQPYYFLDSAKPSTSVVSLTETTGVVVTSRDPGTKFDTSF